MKSTIILNGKITLILTPENTTEEEVIKTLNGGKVAMIGSNAVVLQHSVAGGLMITSEKEGEEIKNGKS